MDPVEYRARMAARDRLAALQAENKAPFSREPSAPSTAAIEEEAYSEDEDDHGEESERYNSNSPDGDDSSSDSGDEMSDSDEDGGQQTHVPPSTMSINQPLKRTRRRTVKAEYEDSDNDEISVKAEAEDDAQILDQADEDSGSEYQDEGDHDEDEDDADELHNDGNPSGKSGPTHRGPDWDPASELRRMHEMAPKLPFVHPGNLPPTHNVPLPEGMESILLPLVDSDPDGVQVRYHVPRELTLWDVPSVKDFIMKRMLQGVQLVHRGGVPVYRRRRFQLSDLAPRPEAPDNERVRYEQGTSTVQQERSRPEYSSHRHGSQRSEYNAGVYSHESQWSEHSAGALPREMSRSQHSTGVHRSQRSLPEHRASPYQRPGPATQPFMQAAFPGSAPPVPVQLPFAMGCNLQGISALTQCMCPMHQQLRARLMWQLQQASPQTLAIHDDPLMQPFGPQAQSTQSRFASPPQQAVVWRQTIEATRTMQPVLPYQQQPDVLQPPYPQQEPNASPTMQTFFQPQQHQQLNIQALMQLLCTPQEQLNAQGLPPSAYRTMDGQFYDGGYPDAAQAQGMSGAAPNF